ncbi:MAG: hypothetical protein JW852_02080 [Spirochaetales bacterium]|nr:hypothetical protein [Spirochaetales bacterium]
METRTQKSTLSVDHYDNRPIYCRMLGHELTFQYCRLTGDGHFCRRIFDCWHNKIDIFGYITSFFSADEIREVLQPPAPKIHTLLNLIEKSGGKG